MATIDKREPYQRVLESNYFADRNRFPGLHALQVANARRLEEKAAPAKTR